MSTARFTAKEDQELDAVFRALADGTRRRIVDRLSRGPASVGDLAEPFFISLAAVSKHLDVLERAKLLRRERVGRFQHCHLTPTPLNGASDFVQHYRPFWESTLKQLADFVEADEPVTPPRRKKRRKSP